MTAPRRVVWSAKDRPACFSTDSEWADWYAFRAGAKFPCVDCTPEHQEKMIRAGRCERPETVFTVRAGDMVGVCSADRGYSVALKASEYSSDLAKRLQSANVPKGVGAVIDCWIKRKSSNG